MNPTPVISLVVSTFQRPDALAAVLNSALSQRVRPAEILVADDGSTDATQAVVRDAAERCPVPLRHLWHRHQGFRLTRVRNMAIASAQGNYIVFVDGDMVLHPDFIGDHHRIARAGFFTQGVRVLLNDNRTRQLLAAPQLLPRFSEPGLGGLRRLYALHAPAVADHLAVFANKLISIKGCNQGFWRSDLFAINGFNEQIQGWGPEDKELCARLEFHGLKRQSLLFGGIAFHLHHAPANRERRAVNDEIFAATLRGRLARCSTGLDDHAPVD